MSLYQATHEQHTTTTDDLANLINENNVLLKTIDLNLDEKKSSLSFKVYFSTCY